MHKILILRIEVKLCFLEMGGLIDFPFLNLIIITLRHFYAYVYD